MIEKFVSGDWKVDDAGDHGVKILVEGVCLVMPIYKLHELIAEAEKWLEVRPVEHLKTIGKHSSS